VWGCVFAGVVGLLGSGAGKSVSKGDVIVVRDTPEGLAGIEKLYGAVMGCRGQYIVEVRFVELSESGARRLGVDWSLAGSVRINVSGAWGGPGVFTAIGAAELLGLLAAEESDADVRLVSLCRLHCIEGSDARMNVGAVVPVPQRTVSAEGTVTTTGYSEVKTGIEVVVRVRTEPDGRLRVYVRPSVSDVSGYVGEAPIRVERAMESSAVVEVGGVFVLGGFDDGRASVTSKGLPAVRWLSNRERRASRLFVVVRVVVAGVEPSQPPLITVGGGGGGGGTGVGVEPGVSAIDVTGPVSVEGLVVPGWVVPKYADD